MGLSFTKLFEPLSKKGQITILMVGHFDVGKTTIVYKLKLGEVLNSVPTIGFNVETVEFKNVKIMSFIVCPNRIRVLWRHYFDGSSALIFVFDCATKDWWEESRHELLLLLDEPDLKNKPLLVLANKQDKALMTPKEVEDYLRLADIKDREWNCVGTIATTGDGLYEAFGWLTKKLEERKPNIS